MHNYKIFLHNYEVRPGRDLASRHDPRTIGSGFGPTIGPKNGLTIIQPTKNLLKFSKKGVDISIPLWYHLYRKRKEGVAHEVI